ncbi:hypothetical protein EJB05_45083, partial [Eragrostis curvula]
MNPPGGVWSDDHPSGTSGNPILQDNHPGRCDVFYYANSVSFVSSVVITILLVNKESFEHGIESYALRVCLVVGLLGLLIAYAEAAEIGTNPSFSSSLMRGFLILRRLSEKLLLNHRKFQTRYKTFFCFNAISFMTSIVVIMLLLSKSVRKKEVQLEVLHLIMILDLLSLMTAFAAGSWRKFWTSVYVFALVAAVLIYLVTVIIVSRQIEKCLRKWKIRGFCSRHPDRI